MSDLIRVKRGLLVNLPELMQGEFGFTTDEGRVYIGGVDGNVAMAKKEEVDGFGYVLTNYIDDPLDHTTAFQAAIDAAYNAGGGDVIVPKGAYTVSNVVTVKDNVRLRGAKGAVITKSSDTLQAFYCNNNSVITRLEFVSTSTVRGSSTSNHAIVVMGDNVEVSFNTIDGSKAAGIVISDSENVQVLYNTVKNTLADGIHTTNKSKNVRVFGNTCDNTGDDAIAVVSYTSNSGYCEDVYISANRVINSKSRGISHIGGKRVIIESNFIDGTASSGILVHLDAGYDTFDPQHTKISKNEINNVGIVSPTVGNQHGIEITSQASFVIVDGNTIVNTGQRAMTCAASGTKITNNRVKEADSCQYENCSYLTVIGNTYEEMRSYGLFVSVVTDSHFTNNEFINNNTLGTAGVDNAHWSGCTRCTINGNMSVDDRVTKTIERTYQLNNCTDIVFKDNKANATGKTPAFTGTSSNIEDNVVLGTVAAVGSVYAIGQMWVNTTTGAIYIHTGSGTWKTVTTT